MQSTRGGLRPLGAALALCCAWAAPSAGAPPPDAAPRAGWVRYERGRFDIPALRQPASVYLAGFQPDLLAQAPGDLPPPGEGEQQAEAAQQQADPLAPQQPSDTLAPQQPNDISAPQQPGDISLATAESFTFGRDSSAGDTAPAGAPASQIGGNSTDTVSSTALGEALSSSLQEVSVQRRSPVILDPYIRGYRYGQLYTQVDGAFQFPLRTDLGNALMFVDSDTIQSATVVAGPYGLRYGPGLAFIDIVRTPTPRYECFEAHVKLGGTYLNNGSQYRGRTTLYGGSDNWGFSIGYGDRGGSDYVTGGSWLVPASYHNKDALFQFGYDINEDQHVNFTYNRLDLSNVEFPAQVFDVSFLTSDAYSASIVDEDPEAPWTTLTLQAWYSRNKYGGNSLSGAKVTTGVTPRIETAADIALGLPAGTAVFLGFTGGGLTNTGARAVTTFGDPEDWSLSFGPDFRFLKQGIGEQFFFVNANDPSQSLVPQTITGGLPQSQAVDPGFFSEATVPVIDGWQIALGGRVDFYHTQIDEISAIESPPNPLNSESQNDILYAFYLTNNLTLDDEWTMTIGGGHAQRAPTLIERYGNPQFFAITQTGFDRFIGSFDVDKERSWQLDLGLQCNYDAWRASLRGYHSFVLDYLTFSVDEFPPPAAPMGARQLHVLNTPLATLSGCEGFTEFDHGRYFTSFASLGYVYGVDQTIDQNLFGIAPLDSRIGLRIHDGDKGQTWGLEGFARVVNNQDRVGIVREFNNPGGFVVIEEASPGFTTWNTRGYYNISENFNVFCGIDNIFNKNYIEHLNIRLQADGVYPAFGAINPGFFPYFGAQMVY